MKKTNKKLMYITAEDATLFSIIIKYPADKGMSKLIPKLKNEELKRIAKAIIFPERKHPEKYVLKGKEYVKNLEIKRKEYQVYREKMRRLYKSEEEVKSIKSEIWNWQHESKS